jgi:cytochrome c-type biogenesis protein CcmH/NrfG
VAWSKKEPNTTEALFYQAIAEFSLKNEAKAEQNFNQVIAKNGNNSSAMYYLGLIAENTGKHMEALNLVATLDSLDQITANELKIAMGITEN